MSDKFFPETFLAEVKSYHPDAYKIWKDKSFWNWLESIEPMIEDRNSPKFAAFIFGFYKVLQNYIELREDFKYLIKKAKDVCENQENELLKELVLEDLQDALIHYAPSVKSVNK